MNKLNNKFEELKNNEINSLSSKQNRFDEVRSAALKTNANNFQHHKLKFASGFFSIFAVSLFISNTFTSPTIEDGYAFNTDTITSDLSSFNVDTDFMDNDLLALELELIDLSESI